VASGHALRDLKAKAYDLIARIEAHQAAIRDLQQQLNDVNASIAAWAKKEPKD